MTPEEFLDAVREDRRTALSRLGSSKALYADTMGEMEPDAVFRAAATAAGAAAETFEAWDDDGGPGAEAARETAAEERTHHGDLTDRFDGTADGETPAAQTALRAFDDPVERAGGLAGWALTAEKATDQRTAFFVGQADPSTSQFFRDYGDVRGAQIDRADELLATVCDGDDDWERAREAAGAVIEAAYDEYTRRLESMGVNPKPVC